MTRALVLLLVGGSFAVPATASSSHEAALRPALRVKSLAPVRVVGSRFAVGERVRIVLSANGSWRRSVRVNTAGSFGVTFPTSVDRCSAYTVLAVGASGDRAALKVRPECAPA